MDWSFRALMVFAGTLAVLWLDHRIAGGAIGETLSGLVRAAF